LKEAYTAGSEILSDTITLYNKGSIDPSTIKLLLTASENSMKRMKILSDEITT
jgi:hypothetical protein